MKPFNLLICVATPFEIGKTELWLKENFKSLSDTKYESKNLCVELLISGVGMLATSYSLTKKLTTENYNLVLNAGIAGAYNRELILGDVVNVIEENIGDLGIEEIDGSFQALFDMDLLAPDSPPFLNKKLLNPDKSLHFLKEVKGLTVNKVSGSAQSISRIIEKYDVDIESMEGAAFFYTCLLEKVRFLQVRSISNYVEPRNKANWQLDLALNNLNKTLIELIQSLNDH